MQARATPQESCPPTAVRTLRPADWILLGVLALFIVGFCIVRSSNRLLWADELLSLRVVQSSTVAGLLRGWREGADGGGVLYYLLARLFVSPFRNATLGLRLFSACGMVAALTFTWAAARRYASTFVTLCAVGAVYFVPAVSRWQMVNGRFYGLFDAGAAMACLWFLVTAERDPRWFDLAMVCLAHLLLVGSHILGLVYSVSLVLGMVALDRIRRRFRWRLYLSAALAWLLFPISLQAMRNSAAIGKGVFWTVRPHGKDLLLGFALFSPVLLYSMVALSLLAWMLRRRGAAARTVAERVRLRLDPAAWAVVASLVLAQAMIFLKSQWPTSVYADRYLLPLGFAAVLVLVALLNRVLPSALVLEPPSLPAKGGTALVLVSYIALVVYHRSDYGYLYPPSGYLKSLTATLPAQEPVLVTSSTMFEFLTHYDPHHTYFFLLDPRFDADRSHPPGDLFAARLMRSWKRAGYESAQIVSCPAMLSTYPAFTLLLDPSREKWFADRLRSNPDFRVVPTGAVTSWIPASFWTVQRLHPAPPPC